MWHKGIPSSAGQASAAKAAKPIPFLQTHTGGNSPFCHWTIQESRGKEKKEKKKKFRERKGIHQQLSYLTSKWKRQETRLFPHCIRHERKQDRKRAGSSQQKVVASDVADRSRHGRREPELSRGTRGSGGLLQHVHSFKNPPFSKKYVKLFKSFWQESQLEHLWTGLDNLDDSSCLERTFEVSEIT
ncbi:uncharacterized protein J5M81_012771 isoform 2-T4 [Pluvialis apricaria]